MTDLWAKPQSDILLYAPWLARSVLSIPLVETNSVKSCATDGKSVMWSRPFVEGLSIEERAGVLVHEILHVLLGHHVRRGSREPIRFNIACDFELNPYVLDAGFHLPSGALIDPQYAGMSAEKIYDLLPDCNTPPEWGLVQDGGENSAEIAKAKEEWEKLVAATAWGNVPNNLSRMFDSAITPKRDLAEALAARLSSALDLSDETWCPPSRRWPGLPSYPDRIDGYVVIAVDTSGSMSSDDISRAVSLCLGICGLVRLDVIWADANVSGIQEDVQSVKDLLRPIGGGGTDFRPALSEIEKRAPDVGVYITDGCGEYGPSQSGIIWVSPIAPPWGEWLNIGA